jgi:hypothetical protein
MSTKRFALIDIHSGYVWGIADASDPISAARIVDHNCHEFGRRYEKHSVGSRAERSGQTGYLVHQVDADFDVGDGRDRDMIEATESFPCVAVVLVKDAENPEDAA